MRSALARQDEHSVLTLRRGLAVLDALIDNRQGLGVNEIARKVALHKSTVSRLCATLEQAGYVDRDSQTGKFAPGARMYRLADAEPHAVDIRQAARPILRALVDTLGETANLVAREGSEFVRIEVVDGSRSLRMLCRVGQRSPAHASAMAKAILAFTDPDEVKAILGSRPLQALTPNTITNKAHLVRHLAEIRERGYSVDLEEIEEGLRCVGAPVRDHTNQVVAAISVSGPRHRFGEEQITYLAGLVCESAAKISARLGAPSQPRAPEALEARSALS